MSLDGVDRAPSDQVRGRGPWAGAVRALERLKAAGRRPIVSVTAILAGKAPDGDGMYRRVRDLPHSLASRSGA